MRQVTLVVLAALLLPACARTVKVQTDPGTGKADVDLQRPGAPEDWSGTLSPVGGSGISGTARGTTGHDMTHVVVTVAGAQRGGRLPWHVHEGRCGDANAPVVGAASAYPPLVVGVDGRGAAEVHLAMDLNEAKSYIVNVHASPSELGTIVACGDFDD